MSIWKFLAFSIIYEQVVRYNHQKREKAQSIKIENLYKDISFDISFFGIYKVLSWKGDIKYDVKDIKAVLNNFKESPINGDWKIVQNNWKEAQQWLYKQEHLNSLENLKYEATKKELYEIKQKMQELEAKMKRNNLS